MNKMFFVLFLILLAGVSTYALYIQEVSIGGTPAPGAGGLSPDWSKLTPKITQPTNKECENCSTIQQCLACIDNELVLNLFYNTKTARSPSQPAKPNFIRIAPQKAIYKEGEKVGIQFYVDNQEASTLTTAEFGSCKIYLEMKRTKATAFDFAEIEGTAPAVGNETLKSNVYYELDDFPIAEAATEGFGQTKFEYDATNEYRYVLQCPSGKSYTASFKVVK